MRRTHRIDYQVLHSTGERRPVNPPNLVTSTLDVDNCDSDQESNKSTIEKTFAVYQSLYEDDDKLDFSSDSPDITNLSSLVQTLSLQDTTMDKERLKQLSIEQNVISSDLDDIATENDIEEMAGDEVNNITTKVNTLRTRFKTIHSELQLLTSDRYEEQYLKTFDRTILSVKAIMKRSNSRLKNLRHQDEFKQNTRQEKSINTQRFLMKEVTCTLKSLYTIFTQEPDEYSYDELILAERNLQTNLQSMNSVSKHMEKILSSDNFDSEEIDKVTDTYHKINELKTAYVNKLQAEIKGQEVAKEQKFQSSKLNIKLTKFKGYDSTVDFYTFKSDFEKLHARSTPSALLPDLLKNNYLDGPALVLVKGVDKIEEIWRRLKASYGDPKLLLTKKLSQLNQTNRLWRVRADPEKQIEILSQMLNFLRDVIKLARQHNIENHLFYGKTLEDIYQLLDNVRQTKWFSLLEEKTLDELDVWKEFIKFLEKELSIQQLKLLHCSPTPSIDSGKSTETRKNASSHLNNTSSHLNNTLYNNGPIIQEKCFVCGETGHVQTNGPNGSKLIQYFSCPQFVQMKPSQRFGTLRQKGLCTQCLFPGALQSRGKHQDGHCQRDFCCPHPSQDDYTIKKHVLICQDHASTPESHQILHNFKERCILRQTKLQQFSKDIRLSFHVDIQSFISSKSSKATLLLVELVKSKLSAVVLTQFVFRSIKVFVFRSIKVVMLNSQAYAYHKSHQHSPPTS